MDSLDGYELSVHLPTLVVSLSILEKTKDRANKIRDEFEWKQFNSL